MDGGFHSGDPGSETASTISWFSSGSPVGISPEMAGDVVALVSVVMGKHGLGSAGPSYPSCSNSVILGVASFSGNGVSGVAVTVP